ncbi:MAG TPA: MlaD family protein [Gemmatimonadaceae bacterium]|nr:MlaD family protein [Gemmatimonadaceae bacterium]
MTLGIAAVTVIALITIATLVFARVGALHGRKVTLYVVTDDATGVQPGTEVWLSGQKQGLVKEVSFRSASSDTLERLLIRTEFLASALPQVRRSSWASIRPGGSLIGAAVVYISAGSTTSPALHAGDTVRTRYSSHVGDLLTDFKAVRPGLADLITGAKELNAMATSTNGTVGNIRRHGFPQLPEVGARMSRLASKASNGNGTIGLAMRNDLTGRATHAMAAADSIKILMASNKSSFGRFRKDTTLASKATGVLAQLDTLMAFAASPMGTIAAAHPDSALTKELSRNRALLAELIRDLKKHPFRYINF